MSNNISNYQEYIFPKLLEQYDKILVPMIQRDYAQGRSDKKATDVRNNLLNDIFSGNKVHFDLVFGSKEKKIIDGKEMNCFIPVDGQQRLTTLFLLYLYGQKAGKTNTELDLSKFSYDTRRAASDFCKSITSEDWSVPSDKKVSDVIKDSSWFMNYWEKDPTVEGMLNMLDAIHEKCKKITDYPDLNKITFFFFDLESNGLNENLYLKMNSRGKPLTAFENLKAKMEKVLPEKIEIEDKHFPKCDASPKDSFKAKWKYFMDRNWTETFWDKEHPEKYDESITKFIVRFLSGYWAAYGKDKDEEQKQKIADELKSLNSKDSYTDFIPFEPIKKVLDLENAFPKLAYALTTAPQIAPYWTNDAIKVSDKSEYKFLAVIFTYVLFDGDKDAKRFAWNMAENFVTGYDNFVRHCNSSREIHKCFCGENISFYQALSSQKIDGNTSDQLKEEIVKAKQILYGAPRSDGKSWEEVIIEAENYAFFKGAIRFLFTDENGDVNDKSWKDFDTKWEKAKKYIDKNGEIVEECKTNAILLRALLSRINIGENWFGYYKEFWHTSLLKNDYQSAIHYLLTTPQLEIDKTCSQDWITQDSLLHNLLCCYNSWHILTNWNHYDVLTRYSQRRSDATSHKEIVVLNYLRNRLLHNDKIEIWPETKVNQTSYLYGWDIQFTYQSKFFQWHREGYVRLIQDRDKCEPLLRDKERESTLVNWYWFKPTSEVGAFTKQLDCLIAQAFPEESDKACCNDCQNKICE